MVDGFQFKDRYFCDDLINIVSILIEAINKNSVPLLREELGDVLLQVVFHPLIETEKGTFTFDDVCDEICKKLIIRHPHVFGDVEVSSTQEVLTNWDAIKMNTKSQKTVTETMQSVPKELPALMRAAKIQKKAAKVGFDWQDIKGTVECS